MKVNEMIAVGGHPALTLLNSTARPLPPDGPLVELLSNGNDLIAWMVMAGLITDREGDDITARYSTQDLDQIARSAVALREWWRSTIVQVLTGTDEITGTLERVNEILAHDSTYQLIESTDNGVALTLNRRWETTTSILAPIAESIADLVVSDAHHLIRNCENPTCTLWFQDRTKAHRRRWCSMAVCGNRAKARAHRSRQRDRAGRQQQP